MLNKDILTQLINNRAEAEKAYTDGKATFIETIEIVGKLSNMIGKYKALVEMEK